LVTALVRRLRGFRPAQAIAVTSFASGLTILGGRRLAFVGVATYSRTNRTIEAGHLVECRGHGDQWVVRKVDQAGVTIEHDVFRGYIEQAQADALTYLKARSIAV
jgi:hypothetical protein